MAGTAIAAPPPIVVKPSDTNGWTVTDSAAGGNYAFVADATAPSGDGALQLTTDNTNPAKLAYSQVFASPFVALSTVTELSYYTERNAGPAHGAASYQLPVFLEGSPALFTTLVFEPYWNNPGPAVGVVPAAWTQWDVDAGGFWSSATRICSNGTITAGAGGPPFYNLAAVETACPGTVVLGFGVKVGSFNPSYDVEVDLVSFNEQAYDFEPESACTTVCYANDATGDDSFGGDSPTSAKKTIQAAVDAVSSGGTVIVAAGDYTEEVTVNKTIDIEGAQLGIAVGARSFGDSSESTLEGVFRLGAPGISVDGFSIQHHVTIVDESAGINVAQAGSGASISNNLFAHIISSALDDLAFAHAIYLNNGPDNVTIVDNSITDVSSQGSAKGILIGDSTATNASLNINIQRNSITDVNSTAKGAYGIQVNNATGATPTIRANRLDNLEGNWARAIAFESTTASGLVEFNVITNLIDQNSVVFPGQVAVYFENNPTMANVGVHRNSLNVGSDSWGVAVNPLPPTIGTVDATCNWWGSASGPGPTASGSGSRVTSSNADYSPWLQTSNLNGDCEENGNITIILETHPEDSTPFAFTGTNGIAPFTLFDDGASADNTKSFDVPAGLYVFRVQALPKWALITLTCNLHETILRSHRMVQIQLLADEDVTCTFTESYRIPDALIGLASGGPFVGDNIYSTTAQPTQTQSQAMAPGATTSFWVQFQNDGLDLDKFRVSSKLKGSLKYKVVFMAGNVEITGKINAGTYKFKLAPGATRTIEIRVKAGTLITASELRNIILTMTSRTAPAAKDVVRATVTAAP